jgi:hypothetical protein
MKKRQIEHKEVFQTKTKRAAGANLRLRFVVFAAAVFLLSVLLILRRVLSANPSLAEEYARGPYYYISAPFRFLSSFVPFSLSEVVVMILPVLFFWRIACLIKNRKEPYALRRLFSFLLTILTVLSFALSLFLLNHGFNYARLPLSEELCIEVRERSPSELEAALAWVVREAVAERDILPEDAEGLAAGRYEKDELLNYAFSGYESADIVCPGLGRGYPVRPKSAISSRLLSYAGIGGIYNPLFVEVCVNVDVPAYMLPFTALHEIAHVQGYAREDEANFLAFLTGIVHQLPEYRYAALATATLYLGHRLAKLDMVAYERAMSGLTDKVRRDLNYYLAYWRSFEGPVNTFFVSVNDGYLKVNEQEDGTRSYGRMVDLLIGFYDQYGDVSLREGFDFAR